MCLTVPSPSCSLSVFLSGFVWLWCKRKENAKGPAIWIPEHLERQRNNWKVICSEELKCSWPNRASLKNPRKRSGGWGRIYKIVMWLVHAHGWILLRTLFLGSKRSPNSTFLSSFQTCRLVPLKYLFNVCYVYILKGDMNFSGHF